jgi:hypothetical protein
MLQGKTEDLEARALLINRRMIINEIDDGQWWDKEGNETCAKEVRR